MTKDMLTEIYDSLCSTEDLKGICIKSFVRPESLPADAPSIVIKPVTSPIQIARGSNTSLAKRYLFQINVECAKYPECKELQRVVEKTMEAKGFYQVTDAMSNLEDYIEHIGRYVDVRTYQGRSPLYQDY